MTSSPTCLSFHLPGDIIRNIKSKDHEILVGPGLDINVNDSNTLKVTQAGNLYFRSPNNYWIEPQTQPIQQQQLSQPFHYIPKKHDLVIGIITNVSTESLRVDIGSSEFAYISMLAFEGSTKKMKPDVHVGDLLYAKVLHAHKEMEAELVCIDQYSKAGRLGVLTNDDSCLVNINQSLTHTLLNGENPLLRKIGKKYRFEIVIGVNGRLWIRSKNLEHILMIRRIFEAASVHSDEDIATICQSNY